MPRGAVAHLAVGVDELGNVAGSRRLPFRLEVLIGEPLLARQVAEAHRLAGIQPQQARRVIGRHEEQGVRPVDAVSRHIDERDGRPDGLLEVGHGADHPPEIVVVVGPIDVALLDHDEKAVGIPAEDPQGRERRIEQGWVLPGGRRDGRRARAVRGDGRLEIASRSAEQTEELPAIGDRPLGGVEKGRASVDAGLPFDEHVFPARPELFDQGGGDEALARIEAGVVEQRMTAADDDVRPRLMDDLVGDARARPLSIARVIVGPADIVADEGRRSRVIEGHRADDPDGPAPGLPVILDDRPETPFRPFVGQPGDAARGRLSPRGHGRGGRGRIDGRPCFRSTRKGREQRVPRVGRPTLAPGRRIRGMG
jgi:hypothetical protein